MHELFSALPHRSLATARHLLLLDTCFLIAMAAERRLSGLAAPRLATTSFNLLELDHVHHHLTGSAKHELRRFLRRGELLVLELPVVPGDRAAERSFVAQVDPSLLREVPDASDAVLAAAALATASDVLTKDKHHLFTTALRNHFQQRGLHVGKEWRDWQQWRSGREGD